MVVLRSHFWLRPSKNIKNLFTYSIHGVVFNWLLGWVYTPRMHPFIHVPRVPRIRPVGQHMQIWGKGQCKGIGTVQGKFSKCGAYNTVIEATEGEYRELARVGERACSCMGSV